MAQVDVDWYQPKPNNTVVLGSGTLTPDLADRSLADRAVAMTSQGAPGREFICLVKLSRGPSIREIADIMAMGVRIYRGIPYYTFIARVNAATLPALYDFDPVVWVGELTPELKYPHDGEFYPGGPFHVFSLVGDTPECRADLGQLGATILTTGRTTRGGYVWERYVVEIDPSRIAELAQQWWVHHIRQESKTVPRTPARSEMGAQSGAATAPRVKGELKPQDSRRLVSLAASENFEGACQCLSETVSSSKLEDASAQSQVTLGQKTPRQRYAPAIDGRPGWINWEMYFEIRDPREAAKLFVEEAALAGLDLDARGEDFTEEPVTGAYNNQAAEAASRGPERIQLNGAQSSEAQDTIWCIVKLRWRWSVHEAASVLARGVKVRASSSSRGFLAAVPGDQMAFLLNCPFVQWVVRYTGAMKIRPYYDFPDWPVIVEVVSLVPLKSGFREQLMEVGVEVLHEYEGEYGSGFRVMATGAQIALMAELEWVDAIESISPRPD